jgi:beta-lactamase class A
VRITAFAAALLLSSCAPVGGAQLDRIEPQLQALEGASGARLGVALADGNGRILAGHRANERFAFCSTFKLLLAGMILDGHGEGRWSLDERLPVTKDDLVFHSPMTETRVDLGWMTIGDAARAIVAISDNAAANLLVRRAGGAPAFNAWLGELGDSSTRLDRPEPELNSNHPRDPRDTTTPQAIAASAAQLLFGGALDRGGKQTLRRWLVESETGLKRIRAGLPPHYVAGDKTGTCGAKGRQSYNDVAFILDADDESRGYVLAVYLDRPANEGDAANASIAQVARIAARFIEAR